MLNLKKITRNLIKLGLLAVLLTGGAQAQTNLTTLYTFDASPANQGYYPRAGLALGNDGNFYGTTYYGANNYGYIYRISKSGVLTNIASFNYLTGHPSSGALVLGNDGAFYGTSQGNNASYAGNTLGTFYRVTTNGSLTVLASFYGTNGANPNGLILASDGNFYGTTSGGGVTNEPAYSDGMGTVFRATTNGVITTLFAFPSITNGVNPMGNLAVGSDGSLYGTTAQGGLTNYSYVIGLGTAFKLATNGTFTSYVFTNATTIGPVNPQAGLTMGSDGNLYGVGAYSVFKLTTNGVISPVSLFLPGTVPTGNLIQGPDGGFYDTTTQGGSSGLGVIFNVNNGTSNILVNFNGTNGSRPEGSMTMGDDGNLYGTTGGGGSGVTGPAGTIFRLGLAPGISVQPTNQTVLTGSNGVIFVMAYGGQPLSYQWFFNSNSLAGATNFSLNFTNVQPTNAGSYQVIVSNSFGSVTSSVATLTLLVNSNFVYTANNVPYAFEDISGTGTRVLANLDDAFVAANIGFNFNFYGTNYTSLFIDLNGLLSFGVGTSEYNNVNISNQSPGVNAPCMAVFWDDLVTYTSSGGDAVYYETLGSPGNRRFIVQWNRLYGYSTSPSSVTFEATLYETNNSILYQYASVDYGDSRNNGASATVGIRNTDGQTNGQYLQWSFNQPVINNGEAILFNGSPIIPIFTLGTTNLLEGPSVGSDSVVLAVNYPFEAWTNSANASWLHLAATNGTGSTNVIFSFDQNTGATRTGTLTIAGQTLTITQAGATYVQAPGSLTTLTAPVFIEPFGMAVDNAGNAYTADSSNNAIKKWTATNNTVTTLVSSGLNYPCAVAVDAAGNVYIADSGNNAIKKWTATNNTVTTLISSGLYYPSGLTLDAAGNVYIADTFNNAIKVWSAASNTVTTLLGTGLNLPYGVAVDVAGNLYIGDSYNNVIKKLSAPNNALSVLVSSGLSHPAGMAVDGSGNLFFADTQNTAIKELSAVSNTVTTLATGLNQPLGVAVDNAGNLYISDQNNNILKELPRAFVDPTPKVEPLASGSDTLPVVLPASENLLAPFNPTSDSPWLTITGVTNGVVSFSYTAGTNRVGHINLLGQSIPVFQPGLVLGTTGLVEGPGAGSDSVVVAENNYPYVSWTNTANVSWLHLAVTNGTGSTNLIFSFDQNNGATRTGTITIAAQTVVISGNAITIPSQTVTITQSGATYVQAPGPVTTLASGLSGPFGIAIDPAGNVYIADQGGNAIRKWTVANNTVSTIISTGLNAPSGVAQDAAGNLYIADENSNRILKWTATNGLVTPLVTGLYNPISVAVDASGNVFFADTLHNAVGEWVAASGTVTNLVTGLYYPYGVALDAAGNVYIADTYHNAIKEWNPVTQTLTNLVTTGLAYPDNVAVDGSGNVYISDLDNYAVKKWSAASNTVSTLVSSGLNYGSGVAVDGNGDVFFADNQNHYVKELPRVFIDPTPKGEQLASGGNDSLPVVLPSTANMKAPFTPTSSQSWLTITSTNNGVVGFHYNATASSLAYITLFGQQIAVGLFPGIITQPADITVPIGSPALFTATASGLLPLSYQWYFNSATLGGATTNKLRLSPSLTNEIGYYQLVVTNNYGSATSRLASLNVLLQPNSYAISNSGAGKRTIYLGSYPTSTNRLWATTNLLYPMPQWTVIATNVTDTNGLSQFLDTNTAGIPAKFYRLSEP